MEQTTVLVTADGKHVLPANDEFFTALRRLAPDCDTTQFAVRNLGFVKFQTIDADTAMIELKPRGIDRRALLTAELQVGLFGASRFRIRYLDGDHRAEPSLSPDEAVACLRALRPADSERNARSERFRAEPLDYARLMRFSANPLCLLSQKWCAAFGEFDASVTDFAAESGFLGRLVLVSVPRRRPDPVFRFIGGTFPWLDDDFPERALGERLVNLPDKEYGAWVSDHYATVALRGEPRYERVAAHLLLPGGRCYDAHYERLLLPWRTPSGDTVVSLMSTRIEPPRP